MSESSETPPAHPATIGWKAARLIALRAVGFAVPPLVAVEVDELNDSEILARVHATLGDVSVAVRSSAVAEDRSDASFAGMYDTVLDVRGDEALLRALATVRSSALSERVAAYSPAAQGGPIGVVIQAMVQAELGGVAYSHGPAPEPGATGEATTIVAVAGSPAPLVEGHLDGETWNVRPDGLDVESGPTVLNEARAREIATLALAVAAELEAPQEIEWAVDPNGVLWLLQARPVSVAGRSGADAAHGGAEGGPTAGERVVTRGVGASHGVVRGKVRVVLEVADLGDLQAGEVLVAPATEPAWTPAFRLAAAVVTDVGSLAAHAAVVAREFGIPAVVGTGDATVVLSTGDEVVVDGSAGEVRIES